MTLSDPENLISKLRERDQEGYFILYSTYGTKVYNLAYRMIGNKEDAEDITQETFEQVYKHIGAFHEKSQLFTWIYTITKNLCFRYFQNQKRKSFTSFELLIQNVASIQTPSEITALEKKQLTGQIKNGCLTGLITCLSFNQRITFILSVLFLLPIRDISVIINKSEAATKVLVHRARKNIKTFLCKNCSLYDIKNSCHCENMLDYSLKQGLVELSTDKKPEESQKILEQEIKVFRNEIELYRSLYGSAPSEELNKRIQEFIRGQSLMIFRNKKV